MRLALGYSTCDQVELTEQTLPRIISHALADLFWCDGSVMEKGRSYFEAHGLGARCLNSARVTGGADAAIAWKLSTMLAADQNYTHIGLIENDVLLDPDWLEPTLALFEKEHEDGLSVGAVSPRSYVDRVLIQRDGYAVMHNIGAGAIIFTREAAEIVLHSFRTQWWPDNVRLFAQLAGIDLRTYAAFRGNEQWVTTDWGWEAHLARHGLAALALTPAKCRMIGQNPPLEQQGLELTTDSGRWSDPGPWLDPDIRKFELYRQNLIDLRVGLYKLDQPGIIHRDGPGMLFFPHQLGNLPGTQWAGTTELKWSQGFGPFAYCAGQGKDGARGASLSVRLSGICSFLCSGGDVGARATITDTRSGFRASPELPASAEPIAMQVPGGPIPRIVTLDMAQGAVFYGLQTSDAQMLNTNFKFDWSQLPSVSNGE